MPDYQSKYAIGSWTFDCNREFVLRELSQLIGYDFNQLDRDAIEIGMQNTDSEIPYYYEYSLIGTSQIDISISNESGTDTNMILINAPPHLTDNIRLILRLATEYTIHSM
jgi:hypothetical protein